MSDDAKSRQTTREIEQKYEKALQAPVAIADATPSPAADYTRQFDRYWHLGGARIHTWSNGYNACTSGFAVRQQSTGKHGSMFAAHCEHPGHTEWAAWEEGDPYYYPWGNISATAYSRDGAIIDTGVSHPFIWTSTWDSNVYTTINGDRYPYIGQELCYSGSYSGLKCGNVVKSTNELYQFDGYPAQITGLRTEQRNSEPAVGHGDSGGPGYELVSTTSGMKRYAVSIISAIPSNAGAVCQGVPGVEGQYGRKCSPTVWSTSVSHIEAATGWHIIEQ